MWSRIELLNLIINYCAHRAAIWNVCFVCLWPLAFGLWFWSEISNISIQLVWIYHFIYFCFPPTWKINECYKIWCFIGHFIVLVVVVVVFFFINLASIQNNQRNQYKVRCKYFTFYFYEHIFRNRESRKKAFYNLSRPLTHLLIVLSIFYDIHMKEITSCVPTLCVWILMTISAWRSSVHCNLTEKPPHFKNYSFVWCVLKCYFRVFFTKFDVFFVCQLFLLRLHVCQFFEW